VACKEISNKILLSKLGQKGWETLEKELQLTMKLKHKNIVRFIKFLKTENNNYLFLEFCGGGDLRELLRKKQRFSELEA